MTLKENMDRLLDRVNKAALRSNRRASDINIIAVTKTVDVNTIKRAIDYGILHIGENRVQELLEKYEQIGQAVKWHLIGHLQRNKVKYIVDKVDLIHSLDSYRLAVEIDKRAKRIDRVVDCLLQVNVSGEESKHGLEPGEVETILGKISSLTNIRVLGLMTMAPHLEDKEETRQYFKALREIFNKISEKDFKNVEMKYLSMGMTNDFEVAVEEGAGFIRIGRSIFGERTY